MATAKVIKGATRMVEKTVRVEEKQPDKIVLELSQDEVNVLRFITGTRYSGNVLNMSTIDIYTALKNLSTEKLEENYKIVSISDGWKIIDKPEDNSNW